MNHQDINPFIVESFKSRVFSYYLPKDHPIHKDVLENCKDFEEVRPYLKEKYGSDYAYYGGGVSVNGKITRVSIIRNNNPGVRHKVHYKGLEFWLDADTTGIIRHALCRFETGVGSKNSTFELSHQETLEQYYQEAIRTIKRNKRKTMNYYNKLIKDIKQDYKEELKRHNDILKGAQE